MVNIYIYIFTRNILDEVDCGGEKCQIKFLAVLGDIADTAEKSEFLKAKNILDKLNEYDIPYISVFGNHDVWPYTGNEEAATTLGEQYFDEIFWDENATNTKLLIEKLNFQRDEANPNYKNFVFSYRNTNFIGLDFAAREPAILGQGVGSDAVLGDENENWLKFRLEEFKEKPVIIFSHHPFIMDPLITFEVGEMSKLDEKIKISRANVLANFAGHVHGFEEWYGSWPENANIEYPTGIHWYTPADIPVLTTEALMVGSNEKEPKGIIRIVKVLNENQIDYNNWETTEGTKTEFIALNPYMTSDYKSLSGEPCMIFKGQAFTKKENSLLWEVDNNIIGSGEKVEYCFSEVPKTYEVKLTTTDKTNPEIKESIFQKILVKAGIIPRFIKGVKETIELVSTTLLEDLTKVGRTVSDTVLAKVKHSESVPVGLFNVHFEQASGDIDLTNMVVDSNIETRKSILYMPRWPTVVEKSKALFISSK